MTMTDKEFFDSMTKAANALDELTMMKEADEVDGIIKEAVDWGGLARGAMSFVPGLNIPLNIAGALRGKQSIPNAILSSLPGVGQVMAAHRMGDALFNDGKRWESQPDKEAREKQEYQKLQSQYGGQQNPSPSSAAPQASSAPMMGGHPVPNMNPNADPEVVKAFILLKRKGLI